MRHCNILFAAIAATPLLLLSGCVMYSKLGANYHVLPDASNAIPSTTYADNANILLYGNDMTGNERYYRNLGYVPIGFVRYIGGRISDTYMRRFIIERHAAFGIYYFNYCGTRYANFQMTTPAVKTQTGTIYGNNFRGTYTGTTYGTQVHNFPIAKAMYDQTLVLYCARRQK